MERARGRDRGDARETGRTLRRVAFAVAAALPLSGCGGSETGPNKLEKPRERPPHAVLDTTRETTPTRSDGVKDRAEAGRRTGWPGD